MDPTPVCNCTCGTCGESCLNAMLRTECVCGNGIRARQELLLKEGSCGSMTRERAYFFNIKAVVA